MCWMYVILIMENTSYIIRDSLCFFCVVWEHYPDCPGKVPVAFIVLRTRGRGGITQQLTLHGVVPCIIFVGIYTKQRERLRKKDIHM